MLVVDTAAFERELYKIGERGQMRDANGQPRQGTTLSLQNALKSFGVQTTFRFHNAGNDALVSLFLLQKLLEPDTPMPRTIHEK